MVHLQSDFPVLLMTATACFTCEYESPPRLLYCNISHTGFLDEVCPGRAGFVLQVWRWGQYPQPPPWGYDGGRHSVHELREELPPAASAHPHGDNCRTTHGRRGLVTPHATAILPFAAFLLPVLASSPCTEGLFRKAREEKKQEQELGGGQQKLHCTVHQQ